MLLRHFEDFAVTVSTELKVSLLRPLGGSSQLWQRFGGENKAFIGDVQSVLGFTQHCPASCHLNPARRLLQALVPTWRLYGNELQFCFIVSLTTKPGSVTWGSVDPQCMFRVV